MSTRQMSKSRRQFLKQGVASLAGASMLPSMLHSEDKKVEKQEERKEKVQLVLRTLGRTGIKVPVIGLGCGFIEEPQMVHAALDSGLTHLDTGYTYGNGNSETMLGKVFTGRPRDSFVIATKIYLPQDNRTGKLVDNVDGAMFSTMFAESLRRLKLDFVDILYLHDIVHPDAVGVKPIMEVMCEIKKQGKAKAIGISTHQNEPAVIRATTDQKIYDVILTAYNFRQPHQEEVKKAIAYAANAGLGVVAMKTQAGVYWDRERKQPINMKAALKWVLQDENVHTTVPGMTSFDQLETNLSIMADMKLTPGELADLKLSPAISKNQMGLFCSQCSTCRSQCRYNLDIPVVMRSYMYAYGYKKPSQSRETLAQRDIKTIRCRECSTCAVTCPMGFDVKSKMKDIIRILDVPGEFLV